MAKHGKSAILFFVFAVILSFTMASKLSACDVTEVHFYIGADITDAANHNTDTVYKVGDTHFYYHVHITANEPNTEEFELKIYDPANSETVLWNNFHISGTATSDTGMVALPNIPVGTHSLKATVKRVGTSTTVDSETRTLVVSDLDENTVFVISDASDSWSENSTPSPVAHDKTVHLRAVIKVTPAIEQHNYFWGEAQDTATVGGLSQIVYQWNNDWGAPNIVWKKVMPYKTHVDLDGNDPGTPTYTAYTNNSQVTGAWLGSSGVNGQTSEGNGYDIIEYNQTSAAWSGWEGTIDTNAGTTRYRISDCYFSGYGNQKYTPGKENTSTGSNLYWTGDDDAYDQGIKNSFMRIVRTSNNANTFISHIESYEYVPWIFGSEGSPHQTERYVGFDCADLAVGAGHAAGVTSVGYTNANGLAGALSNRGSYGVLYQDNTNIRSATTGDTVLVPIGTGANDFHIGDLLFIDYNANGIYDHTTILYADNGTANQLDPDDEMIYASQNGANGGIRKLKLKEVCGVLPARFCLKKW